jgi:hypothetical protein
MSAEVCASEQRRECLPGTLSNVKVEPHRPPRLSAGNGEERAAQIERIRNRLDRLHRFSEHMIAEVAAMREDVKGLDPSHAAATPKTPESN